MQSSSVSSTTISQSIMTAYSCIREDLKLEKVKKPISQWDMSNGPQLHQQPSLSECLPCYEPKICHSCGSVVTDFYIMKVVSRNPTNGQRDVERYWHERCLRCCMCDEYMKESCFERRGLFYCRADYIRTYENRCFVCEGKIESQEMIMKPFADTHCHTACFRCVVCQRQLSTGDMYSADYAHGWLYCPQHSMSHTQTNLQHISGHTHTPMDEGGVSGINTNSSMYWSDEGFEDCGGKSDKRPRTVLSSNQRKVLKAAFDADPKPSKKARHIMAGETGLSNRVVQVWFQNQRAKMKKRIKCTPSSTYVEGGEMDIATACVSGSPYSACKGDGRAYDEASVSSSTDDHLQSSSPAETEESDVTAVKQANSPSVSQSNSQHDDIIRYNSTTAYPPLFSSTC